MRVTVASHNPNWATDYAQEANAIRAALVGIDVVLHHIGSTAIKGIHAKPIIDVMGSVPEIVVLDDHDDTFKTLGYEVMGEFGITGRRYFRKINADGLRTHHLHIYQTHAPDLERHLAFRDYLIAHPAVAEDYSKLKRDLTEGRSATWEDYMDAKDPFIQVTEREALAWYRGRLAT